MSNVRPFATPHEQKRLSLHVAAGSRATAGPDGLRLNHPRPTPALIASFLMEGARYGRTARQH
ncbi:urease subunit gamma [Nonomuraea dietziae]|uniref:urease subunit gamma n=1 Tax=Nonomuraea dietziae TaxID=65515 RepID=UPI0031D572C3